MVKTEEVLAFPHRFFFRAVAPLNLEELDPLAPHDTSLLIQDLNRVLGVSQIRLERCHFRLYYIYGCLQTLLQL
jgi:hypothetical protein